MNFKKIRVNLRPKSNLFMGRSHTLYTIKKIGVVYA